MKKTSAIIVSVLWTGKNPKEIERFCSSLDICCFFTDGSLYLPSFVTEGSLIEAIDGYGIIRISQGLNNVK